MSVQPVFVSSGDLVADRRYRWALDYLDRGDAAAAADILRQVVEDAPGFATAWFALGTIREKLGDRGGAIAAFEMARDADPEDRHGAQLHLSRLGVGDVTPTAAAGYARRLFDQHAPEFDEALVGRLSYRGPELLLDAVRALAPAPMRFEAALDLGCGTGLAGVAFKPYCARLMGVDVSPGMIEQARGKGVYDRLAAAELMAFLAEEFAKTYDLVLAADVLVYVADLAPVCAAVARVLKPGGLLAFTVETHDAPGVRLQATLRYAHGAGHVRSAIEAARLGVLRLSETSTRTEKGVPVRGLLAVAS